LLVFGKGKILDKNINADNATGDIDAEGDDL
jgi:hypothetical protein